MNHFGGCQHRFVLLSHQQHSSRGPPRAPCLALTSHTQSNSVHIFFFFLSVLNTSHLNFTACPKMPMVHQWVPMNRDNLPTSRQAQRSHPTAVKLVVVTKNRWIYTEFSWQEKKLSVSSKGWRNSVWRQNLPNQPWPPVSYSETELEVTPVWEELWK